MRSEASREAATEAEELRTGSYSSGFWERKSRGESAGSVERSEAAGHSETEVADEGTDARTLRAQTR